MSSASAPHPEAEFVSADYREVLAANNSVYEWLLKSAQRAHKAGETELTLQRVERAAEFAERHHPGRLADGALENIALEIGQRLNGATARTDQRTSATSQQDTRRRVLHVATRVYAIGGHTRMLRHWVENDSNACHSLVLLNQANEVVPAWLADCIERTNGSLHQLSAGLPIAQRALQLRNIAQRDASLVVLHHHPYDVGPTVAFANADGPPVALLNHADHVFWLGSSVSDVVIDLRSAATSTSVARRFARRSAVLPIPIAETTPFITRADARASLGIPDNQMVLLSIGRGEKYRPCDAHNFPETAARLLDENPDAHLYVVGASRDDVAPYVTNPLHPRLHLVGNIEDPTNYRRAADIYLESFPFGSNTALLEAGECALPIVTAYAPLFPLLVAANDSTDDLLPTPRDEHEYRQRVQALAASPELRRESGAALQRRIVAHHIGAGWLRHLASLYTGTVSLSHAPAALAPSTCNGSNGDIGLTLRSFFAYQHTPQSAAAGELSAAIDRYAVAIAREAGDFAAARRFAVRGVMRRPRSQAAWRLLTVATLGRAAKFVVALVQLRWSAQSLGLGRTGDTGARRIVQ